MFCVLENARVTHVPNIIIVDDHTGLQSLLCQILAGCRIFGPGAAAHLTHALKLLHEKTPAIVLMDWQYDGMSARDFIDAAQAQFSDVNFIVTITHKEVSVELAEELSIRHILRKPYQVDELDRCGWCMRGRRNASEACIGQQQQIASRQRTITRAR